MRARFLVVILGIVAIAVIAAGCPQNSDTNETTASTPIECSEWTHTFGNEGSSRTCGDSVDVTPDLLASRVFSPDLGTLVYMAPAEDKIILLFDNPSPQATNSSGAGITYVSNHTSNGSLLKIVELNDDESEVDDLWAAKIPGDRGHTYPILSNGTVVMGYAESGTCTVSAFGLSDGEKLWDQEVAECSQIDNQVANDEWFIADFAPTISVTQTVAFDIETGEPGFSWEDIVPAVGLIYDIFSDGTTLFRHSDTNTIQAFDVGDGSELWTRDDLPLADSFGGGFVGDQDSLFVSGKSAAGEGVTVLSLDPETGETLWLKEIGADGSGSFLVKDPGAPTLFVQGFAPETQSLGIWSLDPATGEQTSLLEYPLDDFAPGLILSDQSNLYSLDFYQPRGELGDEEFPPEQFQFQARSFEAGGGPPSNLWKLEREALGMNPNGVVVADGKVLFFGTGSDEASHEDTLLFIFGD